MVVNIADDDLLLSYTNSYDIVPNSHQWEQ